MNKKPMYMCRDVTLELQRFGGNLHHQSTMMDRPFCKERQVWWQ